MTALAKKLYAEVRTEGKEPSYEEVLDHIIGREKEFHDRDVSGLKPQILKRLTDGTFGREGPSS